MNSRLEDIAKRVLQKAKVPEDENFGSVIAILMVVSIIVSLVRVIQECNKSKLPTDFSAEDKYNLYGSEIKSYSVKRGWFTKLRIKKLLRNKMSKDQYAKYSIPLLNSLLDTGENLDNEDIITLVETANV